MPIIQPRYSIPCIELKLRYFQEHEDIIQVANMQNVFQVYMWSCWALAFSTGEKTHAWTSSWEACSSWSEQGCYHYIGVGGGRDMVATSMSPPCTCFWNWKRTVIYIYMYICPPSSVRALWTVFFCRHSNNSRPEFVGPLSINDHLKQAKRLFENQIVGPESFAVDKEGTTNVPTHTSWYSGYPQWPHRCSVWELDSIFLLSMIKIKMCPEACIPYQCSIIEFYSINSSVVLIQFSIFVHIWYYAVM